MARENPVNRIRSSPGQTCGKLSWTLVRRAECDRVRIPLLSVILSPGSRSDILRGKTRIATATSRINAYRGWCRTPVLHQPFAAKKYDTTIYRKLQVFFQQIVKYFLKNSAFCRNSLSRPFPAFPLWGYHLLPWYIIHVPAQKARAIPHKF